MNSLDSTQETISAYLHGHDMNRLSDDAVFKVMSTGQEYKGKKAIEELMHYFYSVAFSANFLQKELVVAQDKAVLEADFYGTQLLEFAGIKPKEGEVHVPLCVVYQVKDGKITGAHIYFESDVLR
jgi:predicted ester cyclase